MADVDGDLESVRLAMGRARCGQDRSTVFLGYGVADRENDPQAQQPTQCHGQKQLLQVQDAAPIVYHPRPEAGQEILAEERVDTGIYYRSRLADVSPASGFIQRARSDT